MNIPIGKNINIRKSDIDIFSEYKLFENDNLLDMFEQNIFGKTGSEYTFLKDFSTENNSSNNDTDTEPEEKGCKPKPKPKDVNNDTVTDTNTGDGDDHVIDPAEQPTITLNLDIGTITNTLTELINAAKTVVNEIKALQGELKTACENLSTAGNEPEPKSIYDGDIKLLESKNLFD